MAIQEVGYCDNQSYPEKGREQEHTQIDDGMYSAHDEHQRHISDDNADADGKPEPLELMLKDAFACECDESVATGNKKDGEKVPELAGVLLENIQPINNGDQCQYVPDKKSSRCIFVGGGLNAFILHF